MAASIGVWLVGYLKGVPKDSFSLGRNVLVRQLARDFVKDLHREGAEKQVVQGEVGVFGDVQKAVGQIEGPIGSVIQAAMGLDVGLTSDAQAG